MKSYFFVFLFFIYLATEAQTKSAIVFYNTENFFDTINNPNKSDEEYLPYSDLKWNSEKYFNKISKIGQVIDSIGSQSGNLPIIIGFCEIESGTAIEDLIKKSSLNKGNYAYKITDSPDTRGINLALLFRTSYFDCIKKDEINVSDPEQEQYFTRNILYVKLKSKKGEFLHVFVNHWPSRRGGEKESESKRIYAAKKLRSKTDSILREDKSAQLIIMGDFNDHPNDKSIKEILISNNSGLINLFEKEHLEGRGSHYYDGQWGVLDQIIFSEGFLEKKGWYCTKTKAEAYRANFLLFKNNKTGEIKPNRTFGGTKYYNGYSDHLPVFIEVEEKK